MTAPTLLLVEDSLTIRMDLTESFQEAGFVVRACATLEEARRALDERTFDLAVLDMQLPDGEGLELLGPLKSDPARPVPVMVLSSESEVRQRVRGLRTGVDEWVGKPYVVSQVLARARELIGVAAAPRRERTCVLVIDDSLTLRTELEAALGAAGHDVLVAASGEEGLRLAVSGAPDAVVVDFQLPGIDGSEVIRRMRHDARLRHVPCLLLTGSEGSDQRLALDSGADAFVNKSEGCEVVLLRLSILLRSDRRAPARLEPSHLTPKRMLVVDDSTTYREEIAEPLRAEGYDVVLAASGEEALELLSAQTVDCVILDMVMPGLSGHETCRRIRQAPGWRDVPVIMNTAYDDRRALIEGINAGADDYISKTAELDVLKARVRAQLRRKQFEEENRHIRDELTRKEIEATAARAARDLAAALERKNVELQEQNRRVEEATRMKSEFLASMSHELRTPLNAIIGFSELLHDEAAGPINATQREFLGDVLTSSRHLLQLIDDVLDLAKVEAGKMVFCPVEIDLALLVREVCDVARSIARRKEVAIETTVEAGLSARLDPGKLKQVLYNYLSNAIKFSPERSTVEVRVASAGVGRLRLQVSDRGVGISEEDQRDLWKEFRQVGVGPGKRPQGTGLGLALTLRIVEAQGGSVGLRSAPGQGSTFWAELPRGK